MSGTGGRGADDRAVTTGTDAEVAAGIAAVAHEPFREVWRRHAEEVWGPVRRVLEEGVAAHGRALDELASTSAGDGPEGVGSASEVGEAPDRYRHAVASGVLEPFRQALRDHDAAGKLEASLGQAMEQVVAAVGGLPALVRAPISPTALQRARGIGAGVALKRVLALALRVLVWRREAHDIPMVALARRHVSRTVLPHQVRAFRNCQRLRGEWLGEVERSWSGWLAVVLARPDGMDAGDERGPASAPGRNDHEACLEAGNVLHQRLLALVEQVAGAAGQSLDHGLSRCAEALHARVGVAGTFVADQDEGTPFGWKGQKGTAANWDRWAGESAARLGLCLELLRARRLTDGVRRELNADWTRAVREIEAGLDEIDARLAEGRKRAAAVDAEDAALSDKLGHERLRTGAGLDDVEATLPDPGQLLDALADAATRADGSSRA